MPPSRIALKTDYHDCYDVWLERPGSGAPCLGRMAGDSWSVHRSDMFDLFDRLGLAHPAYGRVAGFGPGDRIVVYSEPFAHCGEGKRFTTGAEAMADGLGDAFASAYVADLPGHSYRLFVIAGRGAWFQHWSVEDWRSNCGDGDLSSLNSDHGTLLGVEAIEAACAPVRNPVYAIDFVGQRVADGLRLLAIDWNPAPRLAGTPAQADLAGRWGGHQGLAEAIAAATLRELAAAGGTFLDNNRILLAPAPTA
jgi:hypothetical protein